MSAVPRLSSCIFLSAVLCLGSRPPFSPSPSPPSPLVLQPPAQLFSLLLLVHHTIPLVPASMPRPRLPASSRVPPPPFPFHFTPWLCVAPKCCHCPWLLIVDGSWHLDPLPSFLFVTFVRDCRLVPPLRPVRSWVPSPPAARVRVRVCVLYRWSAFPSASPPHLFLFLFLQ